MFAVMHGKRVIKEFPHFQDAMRYTVKVVYQQPLERKNRKEAARTPTYNIVEV